MKFWHIQSNANQQGEIDLFITDEIGNYFGHTAKELIDELQAQSPKHINLHVNSPGGSVFEGMSIYHYLKAHSAKVTTYIDGIAASIASVIALAGDEVIMPEGSMMFIHAPLTLAVFGDATDLENDAKALRQIEESIASVYMRKTGASREQVQQWMEGDTYFTAQEAKAAGLVDTVSEGIKLVAKWDGDRYPQYNKFLARQPDGQNQQNNKKETIEMTQEEHDKIVNELKADYQSKIDTLKSECDAARQDVDTYSAKLAEAERKAKISAYAAKHGIDATAALSDESVTVEAFKDTVIESLAQAKPSQASPIIEEGAADSKKPKALAQSEFNALPVKERRAHLAAGGEIK